MIAIQEPPQPAAVRHSGEGVVVCLMRIALPFFDHYYPPRNRIGLLLLCSALSEAALADGHCASGGVVPINELNNGTVTAIYDQPAPAAQCWLAALKRLHLDDHAHLAWKDSTGAWHKIHPHGTLVDFEPLVSRERFKLADDQLAAELKVNEITIQILRRAAAINALGNQS
jgi:hypothetical protein